MDEQYLFAGSNIIHQDDDAIGGFIGVECFERENNVSVFKCPDVGETKADSRSHLVSVHVDLVS